eukprot:1991567-Pyramimonas_sp.AAC.1
MGSKGCPCVACRAYGTSGWAHIASLCPTVIQCAEAGDAVAEDIIQRTHLRHVSATSPPPARPSRRPVTSATSSPHQRRISATSASHQRHISVTSAPSPASRRAQPGGSIGGRTRAPHGH